MNYSKYSYDDRKHIVELIENLKNNEDYIAIFDILTKDGDNTYTQNSNGVFLNLSKVSDPILDKINKYIIKANRKRNNKIESNVDVIPLSDNSSSDRAYKLNNYEKNIIKQRNLKKVLNDLDEYEELRFTKNKTKTKTKNIEKNI